MDVLVASRLVVDAELESEVLVIEDKSLVSGVAVEVMMVVTTPSVTLLVTGLVVVAVATLDVLDMIEVVIVAALVSGVVG